MVQLGKLWGDGKFTSLSPLSKLLYSYLISQPSISTLGVLVIDRNKILFDLKLKTMAELSQAYYELIEKGYIRTIDDDNLITIVVLDHFNSLSKSKLNLRKATDELDNSGLHLRMILEKVFTYSEYKDNSFVPPSPQEVSDYAASLGFAVDGKRFVEYYEDNDWYDKNNKKVRAWKAKVRKVWCREENRIKTVKGAPKGFENFFIEIEGLKIYPESWKNGLPSHSNFIYAEYLTQEFNEQKNS